MNAEIIAKYLTTLKNKTDLSYEAIGKLCDKSEATVKNLCLGKTDNPGIDTVAPIIYALGGSIDEMYNPDKNKDEVKETSLLAMKDIYENQLIVLKETNEKHVHNIRSHYEQHHQDMVENFKKVEEQYEKRLADQRDVIETHKKENISSKIVAWVLGSILVALLIAEVMNPTLGWLRF